MIKISVVISTYQRISLLDQCINALLSQTLNAHEYEILIVSDGPDEATQEIVKKWSSLSSQPFIHYLALQERKGPAAARNFGWRHAQGIIIAFTNDDCLPSPHWLQTIWDAYPDEKYLAFSGKTVVPLLTKPTDYELNIFGLQNAEFITANCACTKEALINIQGFDERFNMAWREDNDLHFKLIRHHIPILKIHATVMHPTRSMPWWISLKEEKKGMFNALLYKKHPELYNRKGLSRAPWNYYAMIFTFVGAIISLIFKAKWIAACMLACWLMLLIALSCKRLTFTLRTPIHIMEVIITSALIPFFSVYWQQYGAWKYRVIFF